MLTVVKRDEGELADWIRDEVGFITSLCKYQERPIDLEPYQTSFLQDRNQFRWVTKARQVGFSFLLSLEALARCHLKNNHTSVFVSFALDEAKERVALARAVHEALPLEYQKKLAVDTRTELAFVSNGAHKSVSRIVSVPSKAPRGKGGCVILDELAHYANDQEVYSGATALISRSGAQLTGISTPLGKRGIFWQIACEELKKYPRFNRRIVPWWYCRTFCKDPLAAARAAGQEACTTQEMLQRFGLPAIIDQFESLTIEDFEQEFCTKFVDESYSFYPYELILPCTDDDVQIAEDYSDIAQPTGRLVAGFDVGRTRDSSELAIFEEVEGKFTCRMLRSFVETPFAQQEGALRRMLETLPIARLSVDSSGIGMNIAENLTRDYPQVVAESFSTESKERWANNFKILLQKRHVVLPKDRNLTSQIHSIKKHNLPSGKASFDAERTARHGHADKFWATVMACQMERGAVQPRVPIVTARIIGTREENLREARREAGIEEVKKHPWEAGPVSEEPVWIPQGSVSFWPFR